MRKKFSYIKIIIILALSLTACSEPNIKHLKTQEPQLNMKEFFRGKIIASGLIQNWRGEVTKTFTAKITSHWDDNRCIMTQNIIFNNKSTLNRKVEMILISNNKFTINALDIDGTGIGEQSGNMALLTYNLLVPYIKGEISLSAAEWLHMLPDHSVIADISLRKFGVKVGKIVIHLRKI
jgi:hypothetical protein